jgi:hypothetical protein
LAQVPVVDRGRHLICLRLGFNPGSRLTGPMYAVHDISGFIAERPETLGSKEKSWVTPTAESGLPIKPHLFKIGRPDTGENWAEKVACELAKLLGIPCANYHLATLNGVHGVLSESFIPPRSSLVPANALFAKVDAEYQETLRFNQVRYRLRTALSVIRKTQLHGVIGDESLDARKAFSGYLTLDALIGNTDRHHENWGIVPQENRYFLAPSFDHASSLGRELSDHRRGEKLATRDKRDSIGAYAERGRSAFYGLGLTPSILTNRQVVEALTLAFPEYILAWNGKIQAVSRHDFESIVGRVPPDFISENARAFAVELLIYNQKMIREVTNV